MILMTISAVFCWAVWVFVIFMIDPATAGILGFGFFYLSLFLSLAGTMSVFGLLFRMKFGKEEPVFRTVTVSFRQATMLGLLVIGGLILKSVKLLAWWNIVLLVLAVLILESFFISYQRRK